MVGIGENAIVPFVLVMHPDKPVAAGLAASVPLAVGSILQLVVPNVVRRLRSHQRTVVLFAFLQGLTFLPLAIGALLGHLPIWLIFICASLYWGAALGAGAAWNTWAGTLVPQRIRAKYFAKRSRIIHFGVLAGLILASLILKQADQPHSSGPPPPSQTSSHIASPALHPDDPLAPLSESAPLVASKPPPHRVARPEARYAFAAMFFCACVCRLVSSRLLSLQSEPIPMPPGQRRVSFKEMVGRLGHGPDARLMSYMLAMQVAIHLAHNFFIPYAQEYVRLSEAACFLLIAAPYAGRMAAFSLLGQIAHRFGARWLLWIGGVGLIPISGLWMVSGELWYLLIVQFLAGVAWAAYELGTFLMIWETVPEGERTSIMTTFNLLNSSANTTGALLGGLMLTTAAANGYHLVFGVALAARLATLVLLWRLHHLIRPKSIPITPPIEEPPEVSQEDAVPLAEDPRARPASHRRIFDERRASPRHSARRKDQP